MSTAATTQTETAVSTVTVTETPTAAAAKLTGDQSMCAYADAIFNYVASVAKDQPKDTPTASLTFLRKVAQDSSDMLAEFDHKYLAAAGVTDEVNQAINTYVFGMALFQQSPDSTVGSLDSKMDAVRTACKRVS